MKTIKILLAAVAAFALAGCASGPVNIQDGQITGLKSHDAANVIKADKRAAEVESLTSNAKPIFKMEGIEGQPIVISGVKSIEVNVPLDPEKVLSRQIESQSEAVQMVREVRGAVRDVLPVIALDKAADVAKTQINAARDERIATTESLTRMSELATDAASKNPVLITAPIGSQATVIPLE